MGIAVSEVIALLAGIIALIFIYQIGELAIKKLTRDERNYK